MVRSETPVNLGELKEDMLTIKQKYVSAIAVTLAVVLSPDLAFAHTFGAVGAGFVRGFAHPFSGLDHLLAMVAVGLWAAQIGGKAFWIVPLSFVSVMAVGGILGMYGAVSSQINLSQVELGVGASVVVLGLIVAASWRSSRLAAVGMVGFFALFHGLAHGAELPQTSNPFFYGGGFVLATAALHGIGMATRLFVDRPLGGLAVRAGGAVIAVVGLIMISGA